MAKDGEQGGLERLKIARSTIARPGRLMGVLGAVFALWLILAPLLSSLFTEPAPAFGYIGVGGLALILGVALVYLNLSGFVVLGADGIFVDRRDDRRYIAFADIDDVSMHVETFPGKTFVGAEVSLRDGERLVLPIGEDQFGGGARANHLTERIRAHLDAYRERSAAVPETVPDGLARGERDAEAWLRRLRGIGAGANASAREAPVESERLWRIVESPSAAPEVRAGAAAALSGGLEGRGKERLRVVLDETAQPRLRVALESALEQDDDALVEALAELENT